MVKKSIAEYTGGGIYIYYGEFSDGRYFMTDDESMQDYIVRILNADPSDFDESLLPEWQDAHIIEDTESKDLCIEILEKVSDGNYSKADIEEKLNRL